MVILVWFRWRVLSCHTLPVCLCRDPCWCATLARLCQVDISRGRAKERRRQKDGTSCCGPTKIIEALVMGTVQFRTAVSKSAQRMDGSSTVPTGSTTDQVHVQAIVPQAKPLSPGEVMGCTHYYDSNKDRKVMSHGSWCLSFYHKEACWAIQILPTR